MAYRIGIDIGGTFTDISLIELASERVFTHKVPSTPSSPSKAVAHGVSEIMHRIGSAPSAITSFIHGTTIGLNAILERRGAKIALFVAEGNRDILEIGRLHKPDLFNLRATLPPPLVARRNVIEVEGRLSAEGERIRPLRLAGLETLLDELDPEVKSVAICFINAHADDEQERAVAELIGARRPNIHVSRSSEIWPEIREYERAMIAVLNAYVQPVMSRYVDNLVEDMQAIDLTTPLFITRSNGGIMSAASARTLPVNTLLSGPASGVVGAAHIAAASGISDAVTIDIGGTSADVSVIRGGRPVHSTEAWIGDFPIITPAIDVFAVGAGGGSIAWFDDLGLLKLGPKSAGAEPGPACYGKGGTEATTTDAYVVCGYIDPDNFVGGTVPLSREAAEAAVGAIARRLGISLDDAAESILRVATSTMASAILPMTTKRGIDPRDFTLIPFGGAGPTHACLLAEEIIVPRILVPRTPGTMCALGAALADASADYIHSMRVRLERADIDAVRQAYDDLERQARSWLATERPGATQIELRRAADLRYRGQAFNVEVELPEHVAAEDLQRETIARSFHETYETLYHNSDPAQPVDLVNLRVRITGRADAPAPVPLPVAAIGEAPQARTRREIAYGGRRHAAAVFDRDALKAGHVVEGPAVIEQFDSTTLVAPGSVARIELNGNIIITREKRT